LHPLLGNDRSQRADVQAVLAFHCCGVGSKLEEDAYAVQCCTSAIGLCDEIVFCCIWGICSFMCRPRPWNGGCCALVSRLTFCKCLI